MADLSDVMTKLESIVTDIVYPNGTLQPSIAGVDVTIGQGYPIPDDLDAILIDGNAMVSIYPSNIARPSTRFFRQSETQSISAPTLTATVATNTITIGGTVSLPQAVMAIVNYVGYSYLVQTGDTLSSIATALASLIPNATALGAVITITSVFAIETHIIVNAVSSVELKRQERVFWIMVWAPQESTRTALAKPIDSALTELITITLSDGYAANIWWAGDIETDALMEARIMRRTLSFKVEYPTTKTITSQVVGKVDNIITASA